MKQSPTAFSPSTKRTFSKVNKISRSWEKSETC
jgi:hypothetical protein